MQQRAQVRSHASFHPDHPLDVPAARGAPGWDVGPERRIDDGRSMARMLGWFSIGLGAAELLAAGRIARFLGVSREHTGLIRGFGVREVASGVAILKRFRDPEAWVWARIAGDAADLAALGAAFPHSSRRGRLLAAMAFVGGAGVLDGMCVRQLRASGAPS